MGLLDRFRNPPNTKTEDDAIVDKSAAVADLVSNYLHQKMEQKSDVLSRLFEKWQDEKASSKYDKSSTNLIVNGFNNNSVAYRGVHMTAMAVAGLDWYVVDANTQERIENHPIQQLLNRPNLYESGDALIYQLQAYKMVTGNSYLFAAKEYNIVSQANKIMPRSNVPITALKSLMAQNVTINASRSYKHPVSSYVYQNPAREGERFEWSVDPVTGLSDVLHLKYPSLSNNLYGLSPLGVAIVNILTRNHGDTWNLNLLQRGGRPSMTLTTEEELSIEERQNLREEIESVLSGSKNAGRTLLLTGDLKIDRDQLSPIDMDYYNSLTYADRQIANAIGIPPQLVGDTSSSTYNNVKEAKLEWYEQTVLPQADYIKSELTTWFNQHFTDLNIMIEYDVDKIPALEPRRKDRWEKYSNAEFLTINEIRNALGYEDIEGGDMLYVPTNKVPIGIDLDTEREPDTTDDAGE